MLRGGSTAERPGLSRRVSFGAGKQIEEVREIPSVRSFRRRWAWALKVVIPLMLVALLYAAVWLLGDGTHRASH
jgi:hypothetical protein